jgi:hypothetical protein
MSPGSLSASKSAFAARLSARRALIEQATLIRVRAIGDDYRRESSGRPRNSEELLADRAYRLLGGEQVDVSLFRYPFEAWHLGLAIDGPAAEDQAREIASGLDCQPLIVTRAGHCTSAWLGARVPRDPDCVVRVAVNVCGTECAVGIGEAGQGLAGWRLSHRQAVAALRVCRRTGRGCARYGTAIGLAAVLQDDLAELTLRRRYIEPLERRREGGTRVLATLRAYLAADRNVSSAAAALGVNRNTVTNRLRAFEEEIGLPLASFLADLELALELHEMP